MADDSDHAIRDTLRAAAGGVILGDFYVVVPVEHEDLNAGTAMFKDRTTAEHAAVAAGQGWAVMNLRDAIQILLEDAFTTGVNS